MSVIVEQTAVIKPHSQLGINRYGGFQLAVNIPRMEKSPIAQRIEERLAILGISARKASLRAGLSPDAIRNVLRNPESLPRGRTLKNLAGALETTVDWLLGEEGRSLHELEPDGDESSQRHILGVQYGGIVEAGAFRAMDTYNQDAPLSIALTKHPKFLRCRQYAFKVQGDSMNAANIEDGMWVIGIDYDDYTAYHGDIRDGTRVVVERSRFQRSERELTIKEVELYSDRMELVPRSRTGTYPKIIVPRDNGEQLDNTEVLILAVVVNAFWDFT